MREVSIAQAATQSAVGSAVQAGLLGRLVGEYGQLEEPPDLVFGEITDVAIGADSLVFVLDSRYNQVRVYSFDGRVHQVIGGPGRGPGELTRPLSIALDSDGLLLVGDLTRAVHVFRPTGRTWSYSHSMHLPVAPYDMCAIGRRLYVHSVNLETNQLVHEIDRSGRVVASFGVMYQSPNALVNYQISRGSVACDARLGLVFYAPEGSVPEVRAYHADGRPAWVVKLTGHRAIALTERDGGTDMDIPTGGYHHLRSLLVVPPSQLLAQYAYSTRETWAARREFAELVDVLMDGMNGAPMRVSSATHVVAAASRAHVVSIRRDPFPQFSVWTRQPSPRR